MAKIKGTKAKSYKDLTKRKQAALVNISNDRSLKLHASQNDNGAQSDVTTKERPKSEQSRGHRKVQELKSWGIFIASIGQNRAAVGIGVLVILEYLSKAVKGVFQLVAPNATPPKFIRSPEEIFRTGELRQSLIDQVEAEDRLSEEEKGALRDILNSEETTDEQKAQQILEFSQDQDEQVGDYAVEEEEETFTPRPSGGGGAWGRTSFQSVFESGQARLQDLYEVIDRNGRQIEEELQIVFNRNQGEGGLRRPSAVRSQAAPPQEQKKPKELAGVGGDASWLGDAYNKTMQAFDSKQDKGGKKLKDLNDVIAYQTEGSQSSTEKAQKQAEEAAKEQAEQERIQAEQGKIQDEQNKKRISEIRDNVRKATEKAEESYKIRQAKAKEIGDQMRQQQEEIKARERKQEEEAKARAAKAQAEKEAQARQAEAKRQAELKAKAEQEERARQAEAKRQAEAEAKAKQAEAKRQAELKAKAEQEERARQIEAKRQAEAEAKAKQAEAKRQAEAEAKAKQAEAKRQAELKAKAEQEERARQIEAKRQAEAEARAKQAEAKREAELKAKAEQEEKARQAEAKKQAEAKAKAEAKAEEERKKKEAEEKKKAEKLKQEEERKKAIEAKKQEEARKQAERDERDRRLAEEFERQQEEQEKAAIEARQRQQEALAKLQQEQDVKKQQQINQRNEQEAQRQREAEALKQKQIKQRQEAEAKRRQEEEAKKQKQREADIKKRQEIGEQQRQKLREAVQAYQTGPSPAKNGSNIQQELQKESKILKEKLKQMDQKGMLKDINEQDYAILLERMMNIIQEMVSGEKDGKLGDVGVKNTATKDQLDAMMMSSIEVIKEKVSQSEVGPKLSNIQDTFGRRKDDRKVVAAGGGGGFISSGGGGSGGGPGGRPGGRRGGGPYDDGEPGSWQKYFFILLIVGTGAAIAFYMLGVRNQKEDEREKAAAEEKMKKQDQKLISLPPSVDDKIEKAREVTEKVAKNKNTKVTGKILAQILAVGFVIYIFKKKRPFDSESEDEEKQWQHYMRDIWKAISGPFTKDKDGNGGPPTDPSGGAEDSSSGPSGGGGSGGGGGGSSGPSGGSGPSSGGGGGSSRGGGGGGSGSGDGPNRPSGAPKSYTDTSLGGVSGGGAGYGGGAGSGAGEAGISERSLDEESQGNPKDKKQVSKDFQNLLSHLERQFGDQKHFDKFQKWLREAKEKSKSKNGLQRKDINNGLKALGDEFSYMNKKAGKIDKDVQQVSQQKSKAQNQVERLQEELSQVKSQLKQSQKSTEDKQKENSKYQSMYVDSEKEYTTLSKERNQIASKVENLDRNIRGLENEKGNLSKQLKEMLNEIHKKEERSEQESQEFQDLQQRYQGQNEQYQQLKDEQQKLQQQSQQNRDTIQSLESRLTQITQDHQDQKHESDYLRMQYQVYQQNLADQIQQCNDQEDQIAILRHEKEILLKQVHDKENLLQEAIGTLTNYHSRKGENSGSTMADMGQGYDQSQEQEQGQNFNEQFDLDTKRGQSYDSQNTQSDEFIDDTGDFTTELDNMSRLLEKFNKDNQAKEQELQLHRQKSQSQEQILRDLNDKLQALKQEQVNYQHEWGKQKQQPRGKENDESQRLFSGNLQLLMQQQQQAMQHLDIKRNLGQLVQQFGNQQNTNLNGQIESQMPVWMQNNNQQGNTLIQIVSQPQQIIQSNINNLGIQNINLQQVPELLQLLANQQTQTASVQMNPVNSISNISTFNNIQLLPSHINPQQLIQQQQDQQPQPTSLINNFEALFSQANSAYWNGDYQKALQLCQPVRIALPNRTDVLLLLGAIYYQLKEFRQSIICNDQCILIDPNMAEAHANLANALQQLGDLDLAIVYYMSAVKLKPNFADAYNNMASAYQQSGNIQEAIKWYNVALQYNLNVIDVHINLGDLYRAEGPHKRNDAINCYTRALNINNSYAPAWRSLGDLYREQGDFITALKYYQCAINSNATYPDAYTGMGICLKELKCKEHAEGYFLQVCKLKPSCAWSLANLAGIYYDMGKLDDAIRNYQEAIRIEAIFPEAYNNLGNAYREKGRIDDAIQCYMSCIQLQIARSNSPAMLHALRINPQAAQQQQFQRLSVAYNNLGGILKMNGRSQEAIQCYEHVVVLQPESPEALANLASAYKDAGRHEEAIVSYKRALNARNDFPEAFANLLHSLQCVCEWTDRPVMFARLESEIIRDLQMDRLPSVQPFHAMAYPFSAELAVRISRKYADHCKQLAIKFQMEDFIHPPPRYLRPGERLRIGYVSSDFGNHPLSHLMGSVFGMHDRSRFEVFCYALSPSDGSQWRNRISQEAEHFIDVSMWQVPDIARQIRQDQIQIAINLNGYTKGARNEIFALKPAPVQTSYMGFPATAGADFIPYIIIDEVVAPRYLRHCYTEKLALMPNCYFVNDYKQTHQEVLDEANLPRRSEFGIPEDRIVYSCSNQLYKYDPDTFNTWCNVLRRVPNSVLWLLRFPPYGESRIRREAEKRGITQDRIIFTDVAMKDQHIKRSGLADVFLDTPICNAHTTGCDVLWGGCPMVTLPLERMASRVAASLCEAVGLGQHMIVYSQKQYEDKAVELGINHDYRLMLRHKLKSSRLYNALFDTLGWVRDLERVYHTMWAIHCEGHSPKHFKVPQDRTQPPQIEWHS